MKTYFEDDSITGRAYDQKLMRQLWTFVKPYWKLLTVGLVSLGFVSAFTNLGPYITKLVIDDAIGVKNLEKLPFLIFMFFLVIVGEFVFRFIQIYSTQYLGQRVMFDLRMSIFRHVQRLSLHFFDRNPVGRLLTRMTGDVQTINEMFTSGVITIIGDVLTLLTIMGFMIALSWRLALLTFTVLPILIGLTLFFRRRIRQGFRRIRQALAAINAYLQENIAGISIVQLFNREKKNYFRFEELSSEHLSAHIRTIFYFAFYFPLIEVINSVAIALILWYGGMKIMSDSLSFGVLVAFIQYVGKFFRPIMDLSEKYNIMQGAMASTERIFKLLDVDDRIPETDSPPPIKNLRGEVEFRDVSFGYTKDYVLHDISFKVEPGMKIALVGATGAGKSSIINCLCRFYDVQAGEILVDGVNIKDYSLKAYRNQVSLVHQDVFLFHGDVFHNIGLGNPDIDEERIIEAARLVNADKFIRRLPQGYNTNLKERGAILSVGQKQLLAFARALAFEPAILILDEATSSIDTETELLIQDALQKLMSERTAIVIAHRLSTITSSDQILVLHKGRIRERGTHAELLEAGGLYHRLYTIQYKAQEGERLTGT